MQVPCGPLKAQSFMKIGYLISARSGKKWVGLSLKKEARDEGLNPSAFRSVTVLGAMSPKLF